MEYVLEYLIDERGREIDNSSWLALIVAISGVLH